MVNQTWELRNAMSSQDNNKSNLLLPNTTQTPNVFYDEYMALLTPEEWKVLCYTIRRIYGFQRTQDHIALSQYTDGATLRDGKLRDRGTGLSRPTVVDALDSLVEYGLIIRLEKMIDLATEPCIRSNWITTRSTCPA